MLGNDRAADVIEHSGASAFVHKFITGKGSPFTLLLLHGTGGDETDMIPIGRILAPAASLLSLRGPVNENGMARFFRPASAGVFDVEDIVVRTHRLAAFLKVASNDYGLDAGKLIPVGYSNGANIAASMLLIRPGHIPAAVLFRPQVVFEPENVCDLSSTHIYISAGNLDPLVSEENSQELASLFRMAGAHVTLAIENATHGLTQRELESARKWLVEKGVE